VHNVRRPPFCLGHEKRGKVITENYISLNDKVTDKLANHKERRTDCYTDKIGDKLISFVTTFIMFSIQMKLSPGVMNFLFLPKL
jgi:hypothetical protein